ncbi:MULTISPECIES: hypothetical protein [Thermocrispum]|jgi:hypothetical protein|uniref:DUF4352 domain-containing protein n=1 Tax=Thermocrispum agreste TaxID=37925 RepID=A0ABD6FD24_9PSEU|nr:MULTISPECIES: hypothetical protein [Thermocrispum]
MRYSTRFVAAAALSAALTLLTGCEDRPAAGSGAEIVDGKASGGSGNHEAPAVDPGQAEDGEAAPGTRDNPLEPGTKIKVGDWTVAVTDVTLDATDRVLKENEFNEPPAKGRQLVMFTVQATYEGNDSGTAIVDFRWAIVGGKGNTFGTGAEDYCGVIPKPLDETGETFPGGTVTGNVCISVPTEQLDGATILVEPTFSLREGRTFYALKE